MKVECSVEYKRMETHWHGLTCADYREMREKRLRNVFDYEITKAVRALLDLSDERQIKHRVGSSREKRVASAQTDGKGEEEK